MLSSDFLYKECAMQTPALGRIVHVFVDPTQNNGADIAPAVITRVWSQQLVNLKVLLDASNDVWFTSVALYDDRESAEKATVTTTASWPDEQPQDDGDVRAVERARDLIEALWNGDAVTADAEHVLAELDARFGPAIAALDARDTKGGE